jgi:hypothetical protein
MDQNPQNQSGNIPQPSAEFGSMPNGSAPFRAVPNNAEDFRSVPHNSERKESHTLTVREVARMFEAAGVTRTERSIVNWCQPNRTGIARLDAYFDPNERRYFISPQTVEQAIAEEKAKAAKDKDLPKPIESVPHASEAGRSQKQPAGEDDSRMRELERENLDLKITNRAKDMEIERTHKERDKFFDQLLTASRTVGALETRLLQIDSSPHSRIEEKPPLDHASH